MQKFNNEEKNSQDELQNTAYIQTVNSQPNIENIPTLKTATKEPNTSMKFNSSPQTQELLNLQNSNQNQLTVNKILQPSAHVSSVQINEDSNTNKYQSVSRKLDYEEISPSSQTFLNDQHKANLDNLDADLGEKHGGTQQVQNSQKITDEEEDCDHQHDYNQWDNLLQLTKKNPNILVRQLSQKESSPKCVMRVSRRIDFIDVQAADNNDEDLKMRAIIKDSFANILKKDGRANIMVNSALNTKIKKQMRVVAAQEKFLQYLKKPMSLRNNEETKQHSLVCQNTYKYFQDLQLPYDQIQMVIKRMNYEFFPKGKNIVTYGEVGQKFYMVIRGQVEVHIPKQYRKSVIQLNKETKRLNKNAKKSIKIQLGLSLAQKFASVKESFQSNQNQKSRLQTQQNSRNENQQKSALRSNRSDQQSSGGKRMLSARPRMPSDKSRQRAYQASKRASSTGKQASSVGKGSATKQSKQGKSSTNSQVEQKEETSSSDKDSQESSDDCKTVFKGSDGYTFGELALISHKPRAATIRSASDCHLAVLDRRSYQILQKQHERMINNKVDILKNVKYFKSLTKTALNKYQHLFNEKNFIRGQYVQKQGQPMTHLYLIIDGEFEIQRDVQFVVNSNEVKFDFKEFLPYTKHNYPNVKNIRFMNNIQKFKMKSSFDAKVQIKTALISKYQFQGISEINDKSPTSLVDMICYTQTGKALAIERKNFEMILKQKDSTITKMMAITSLNNELKDLELIQKRGQLKNQVKEALECQEASNDQEFDINVNERPLDLELMFMKEIKAENFEPQEHEMEQIQLNGIQPRIKHIIECGHSLPQFTEDQKDIKIKYDPQQVKSSYSLPQNNKQIDSKSDNKENKQLDSFTMAPTLKSNLMGNYSKNNFSYLNSDEVSLEDYTSQNELAKIKDISMNENKTKGEINSLSKSVVNIHNNVRTVQNSQITGGDVSQPEQLYNNNSQYIISKYDGNNKSLRNRQSKSVTNYQGIMKNQSTSIFKNNFIINKSNSNLMSQDQIDQQKQNLNIQENRSSINSKHAFQIKNHIIQQNQQNKVKMAQKLMKQTDKVTYMPQSFMFYSKNSTKTANQKENRYHAQSKRTNSNIDKFTTFTSRDNIHSQSYINNQNYAQQFIYSSNTSLINNNQRHKSADLTKKIDNYLPIESNISQRIPNKVDRRTKVIQQIQNLNQQSTNIVVTSKNSEEQVEQKEEDMCIVSHNAEPDLKEDSALTTVRKENTNTLNNSRLEIPSNITPAQGDSQVQNTIQITEPYLQENDLTDTNARKSSKQYLNIQEQGTLPRKQTKFNSDSEKQVYQAQFNSNPQLNENKTTTNSNTLINVQEERSQTIEDSLTYGNLGSPGAKHQKSTNDPDATRNQQTMGGIQNAISTSNNSSSFQNDQSPYLNMKKKGDSMIKSDYQSQVTVPTKLHPFGLKGINTTSKKEINNIQNLKIGPSKVDIKRYQTQLQTQQRVRLGLKNVNKTHRYQGKQLQRSYIQDIQNNDLTLNNYPESITTKIVHSSIGGNVIHQQSQNSQSTDQKIIKAVLLSNTSNDGNEERYNSSNPSLSYYSHNLNKQQKDQINKPFQNFLQFRENYRAVGRSKSTMNQFRVFQCNQKKNLYQGETSYSVSSLTREINQNFNYISNINKKVDKSIECFL